MSSFLSQKQLFQRLSYSFDVISSHLTSSSSLYCDTSNTKSLPIEYSVNDVKYDNIKDEKKVQYCALC